MLVQLEDLLLRSPFKLHHESSDPVPRDGPDIQAVGQVLGDLFAAEQVLHVSHVHKRLFLGEPCRLFLVSVQLHAEVSCEHGERKCIGVVVQLPVLVLEVEVVVIALALFQVLVDLVVDDQVVVRLVDEVALQGVDRLDLALEDQVKGQLLQFLAGQVHALGVLPEVVAREVVLLGGGQGILPEGAVHLDLVEGITSRLRLDDDPQLLKLLALQLQVIDLLLLLLGEHELDLGARVDVLKIAPVRPQLVLAVLASCLHHNEQGLVDF